VTSELLDGERGITDDIARRLSARLGTSLDLWLHLQNRHE